MGTGIVAFGAGADTPETRKRKQTYADNVKAAQLTPATNNYAMTERNIISERPWIRRDGNQSTSQFFGALGDRLHNFSQPADPAYNYDNYDTPSPTATAPTQATPQPPSTTPSPVQDERKPYDATAAVNQAAAGVKGFGQTGVASQMGLRGFVKNADGTWSASPELQQALMGNETAEQARLKNVALNDARDRFAQEASMREKFAEELRQEKENQRNFDANINWALNNPNAPNAQSILAQMKQGRKVGAVVNEAAPMQQFSDAQRMMGLKEFEVGSQNLLRAAQSAKEQADATSLGGFRGAMSKMYDSQSRMYDSEAANKPLHYMAEIEKARAAGGGKGVGAKDVYEGYIKARADATKALEGNPAYMSATPEAKNEMLDTVAKQTMSGAQMQVEAMNPLSPDRIKAMQSDILNKMAAEKDNARYSALNNQLNELRKYKTPGA